MHDRPIFFDPRGKRGYWLTRLGAFLGTVAAVATTLCLVLAALVTPYLPSVREAPKASAIPGIPGLPGMPAKDIKRATNITPSSRRALHSEIEIEQRKLRHAGTKGDQIALGFYAPWEQAGLTSLRKHADHLTHVVPEWVHLNASGTDLDFESDFESNPNNEDVIKIARKNDLEIIPILDNYGQGVFDPKRSAALLGSKPTQVKVARSLHAWLLKNGFQGINIDFELLDGPQGKQLLGFLDIIRTEFKNSRLSISADLEVDNDNVSASEVAKRCDWIVAMIYDQHSEEEHQGPLAGLEWSEKALDKMLRDVPDEKMVVGIGAFAYDWIDGKSGGADSLTFQEAMATAEGYRSEAPSKVIQFDEDSLNSTFEYFDDEKQEHHRVWMLDAVSAYNQWQISKQYGVRGAGLWVLGSEDPSLWSFFDRRKMFGTEKDRKVLADFPVPFTGYWSLGPAADRILMQRIAFPYEISFTGRGEVLQVDKEPQRGERDLEFDPTSGLIENQTYTKYAFPYVLRKSGFLTKKLALTFDDGPDPEWTPPILDELKKANVPAAFFCLGNSVEQHPGLVARIYREGHEVGSHSFLHPNMGEVTEKRNRLELNLTQLAIESAIGRSTILFRPPYNADSEPATTEQVAPVVIADKMGYVTVAENVDPTDWDLTVHNADGSTRPKTANDIITSVVEDVTKRARSGDEGNVILLHDAGGDRSETVKALPAIIQRLRALGYEFVPISQLLGTTRDKVMPPIPAKDLPMLILGKIVLGTTFTIMAVLAVLFVVAIGLGLARIFLITPLALLHRARANPPLKTTKFVVTCLIAAFNEQEVIVRTIESVLASEYPVDEVLIVDDGSSDETAKRVQEAFHDNPRVRLIAKENGGKASALNLGISEMKGELFLGIDADTQLDPAAISNMVRHFQDENLSAVAGNVRVGNEVNILTRWQAIEYTTSQNIDRRAYALLNAITVVPGAIGVWRKSHVQAVGGYQTDTLAEDMDLTWRLRRAGHRLETESDALAYTEAPDTFGGFFRQRFRWAYGTLQCLWKHRSALGRHGWFGRLALPTLWIFQIVFQALAPLVDLQILVSLVVVGVAMLGGPGENGATAVNSAMQNLSQVAFLYALFFIVELVASFIAYRMEKRSAVSLWWLFLQRFSYRQVMYGVIYKSIVRALSGGRTGWGKLERKGSVRLPGAQK